jgi:hypothetical protein
MKGRRFLGQLKNKKFSVETQHDWVVEVENQLVERVTLVPYCFANSK